MTTDELLKGMQSDQREIAEQFKKLRAIDARRNNGEFKGRLIGDTEKKEKRPLWKRMIGLK